MVIGEVAAFRWESGVSPIREGLRSAIVPVPTWHMARIRIEASTSTVIRNDTPLLGGLLLRPVAPHRQPVERGPAPLHRGSAVVSWSALLPKPPPAQPRGLRQ